MIAANKGAVRSGHLNGPEMEQEMKREQDTGKTRANAKAATVQAYCYGYISLESCAALFRLNSDWRAA